MQRLVSLLRSPVRRRFITMQAVTGLAVLLDAIRLRLLADMLFRWLISQFEDSALVQTSTRICYAESLRERERYHAAKVVLEGGLRWVQQHGLQQSSIAPELRAPIGVLNLLDNYAQVLSDLETPVPDRLLSLVDEVSGYFDLEVDTESGVMNAQELGQITRLARSSLEGYFSFVRSLIEVSAEPNHQERKEELIDKYLRKERLQTLRDEANDLRNVDVFG